MKKRLAVSVIAVAVMALVACGGGSSLNPPRVSPDAVGRQSTLSVGTDAVTNAATNAVSNPGFETGVLSPWTACGTVTAKSKVEKTKAHTGTYSALNGTVAKPEVNGTAGICQTVTVPTNATLSFWVWEGTTDTITYVDQEADVRSTSGTVLSNLYSEATTTTGWVKKSFSLSAYAGQKVQLYFGVKGTGYASDYVYQYVDDVSLTAGTGPTSTPSTGPTSTPSTGPTTTPSTGPTPTPSGGVTPYPTPPGSGPKGTSCGISCGVQRWDVKTLDDTGGEPKINWTPVVTDVAAMTALPVPAGYNIYALTRYPGEEQTYRVRATLLAWTSESDNDIHIEIGEVNKPSVTMIAEPPDASCSEACDSGFGSVFTAVRAKLVKCFGAVPGSVTSLPKGVVVDLTGVAFFDELHGQTGVAPNGIELHPLLDVQFISGQPAGC